MSISKMDVSTVEGNTSKKMDINKLMVVGHSMSSHEKILEALHVSGMQYAKLSKNEKLEASAISQTLLKGNACDYTLDESIKQLEVSPLWDGLALDLMLGHL